MDQFQFEWIIDPVSEDEFYSKFYEKKICRIERADADYYKSLLSLEVVDEVLHSQKLSYPKISMVNSNHKTPINSELFTSSNGETINSAKLLKQFAEGSSIVLSGLHDHVSSLGTFVDYMFKYFSHKFQTNVYLTPANAQGFKTHYDTHDVFILQIEGSKKWRIYDNPIELPLQSQGFDDQVEPGEVQEEFILNAGDMLYIPRGIMHDAESNDEISLHVTAGLLGYTWTDFLVESILHISKNDVEFRKYIPIGFAVHQKDDEAIAHFKKLLTSLAKNGKPEEGLDRFFYELMADKGPNLLGQLNQINLLPKISLESEVTVRSNLIYKVTENDEKVIIHLFGQEIEFPAFTKPVMEFIDQHQNFTVSEIPDCMDENGKVVFVKRLVKEGLLFITKHQTSKKPIKELN